MYYVLVLLACLRFDDADTRTESKKTDDADPISCLFQQFVKNCQNCYTLGEMTCIEEMLIGFRSINLEPNKPNKYGLKVMILCDARIHYMYNAYMYTGRNSDGSTLSEIENKLLKPTQA